MLYLVPIIFSSSLVIIAHSRVDGCTLFLLICLFMQQQPTEFYYLLPIYGAGTYQGVISIRAIVFF